MNKKKSLLLVWAFCDLQKRYKSGREICFLIGKQYFEGQCKMYKLVEKIKVLYKIRIFSSGMLVCLMSGLGSWLFRPV